MRFRKLYAKNISTMGTFGKRLRDLREEKGITLKELAVLIGRDEKNNTTISAWEKDKTQPSIEDIVKLADVLNTSTEYLLRGKKVNVVSEPENDYVKIKKDELLELKDKLIQYQAKEIEELKDKEKNLKNIEVVRNEG